MKTQGKPKIPPTTSEEQQIVTLAAGGMSTTRIAQTLGRSRGFVKHTVNEPGIQCAISEEKAELSLIFKAKSRAIIESIDGDVIEKGNLLQRATSAAICLDKSLLLAGDLPQVSVTVRLTNCPQRLPGKRNEPDLPSENVFEQSVSSPATQTAQPITQRPATAPAASQGQGGQVKFIPPRGLLVSAIGFPHPTSCNRSQGNCEAAFGGNFMCYICNALPSGV
jgi:hypothetical protein